ncbi:MAG: hypothetical protein JOZ62_05860 [Acidobacteriaceae bacterium]|nr:hypothetical protein [Acidobacteriaceae bacterium]
MKYSRSAFIAAICGIIASTTLYAGAAWSRPAVIPPELVGAWTHTEWQAGVGHYDPDRVDQFDYRNQDPVGWTDSYRFFADGSYQHSYFKSLDIPGCDVKTLRQELGWIHLAGESVTLENRTAKFSAQDRCHRQNNFDGRPDRPGEPRTFEWRVGRNRNGQLTLLLRCSDGRQIAYHLDPSGHI